MQMRVGIIAPVWVPIPPKAYGGVEWVVHHLVEGLEARGHEVTLVTVGESDCAASKVLATYEDAQYPRLGQTVPELIHAVEAYGHLSAADVIHDHTLVGPVIAASRDEPTVVTVHGPVDAEMRRLYSGLDRVGYVAISDAQRSHAPELNWLGTIHNAVDVSAFPFCAEKEPYLAFLGRMNRDKGAPQAIHLARSLGLPIRIAAKLNEPAEHEFFESQVRPLLGPDAEYLGELGTDDKKELLAGAKALVAPIQWDEPFGMVFIEALSCGTPVLSIARGSVPEIVDDGVTGLLAPDTEMLMHVARGRLDSLDPHACRRSAEERFGLERFVTDHERVYTQLAGANLSMVR